MRLPSEIKTQVIYLYVCYLPGLEDYSSRPGIVSRSLSRGGFVSLSCRLNTASSLRESNRRRLLESQGPQEVRGVVCNISNYKFLRITCAFSFLSSITRWVAPRSSKKNMEPYQTLQMHSHSSNTPIRLLERCSFAPSKKIFGPRAHLAGAIFIFQMGLRSKDIIIEHHY